MMLLFHSQWRHNSIHSLTPLTYGMYKSLGGVSLSIVMLVGVVLPYLMSHSQFCITADEDQ